MWDSKWRYNLVSGISHKFKISDRTESIKLCDFNTRLKQYISENVASKIVYCFVADFWKALYFDLYSQPDEECPLNITKYKTKVSFKICSKVDMTGCEEVDNVLIETRTVDYSFFEGELLFDGTRKFNSVYKKEVAE